MPTLESVRRRIETAMSRCLTITTFLVRHQKNADSNEQWLVYVIPSVTFNLESIEKELRSVQSLHDLDFSYVLLTNLPLTIDGLVNEETLLRQEIFDTSLIRRCEQRLLTWPHFDKIAVIIEKQAQNIPALHLLDLLPDWKTNKSYKPAQITETITTANQIKSTTSAHCYGGPLTDKPDAPTTLVQLLTQRAKSDFKKKIVYLEEHGVNHHTTYADLLDDAARIVHGLRAIGVKPKQHIIILTTRNQDTIGLFWGCILGGFVPVIAAPPKILNNSSLSIDHLTESWQLLDHPLIVTSASIKKLLSLPPTFKTANITVVEILRNQTPDRHYHAAKPHDIAFLNLTSASTGRAKHTILTHQNILSRSRGANQLCQHADTDIILNWLPFDHIGSISDWHLRCIDAACQMVYVQTETILSDPLKWLDLIHQHRITHSWAPNFAYALINDLLQRGDAKTWDLACVKYLLTAGESVSINVIKSFVEHLRPYGLQETVIQPAFGMAETGSGITYFIPTKNSNLNCFNIDRASLGTQLIHVDVNHPNSMQLVSLGTIIPGVAMRIVDNVTQPLPENRIGQLHVKGAAVSPGYYRANEENSAFHHDGWFDTGDLGFIYDDQLVITGRTKENIIINGVNFSSDEIEATVTAIPDITVSFTAAVAVRIENDNTEQLAIFFHTSVTSDQRLTVLLQKIQGRLSRKLGIKADYLLPVAKHIIPKTAIGKIKRKQLRHSLEIGAFATTIKRIDILTGNDNTLPDWFYQRHWRRQQLATSHKPLTNQMVLVFLDTLGLADHVCAQLHKHGHSYITVTPGADFCQQNSNHYTLAPTNPEHYKRLLQSLTNHTLPINHILHCWTYRHYTVRTLDIQTFDQCQALGSYSILLLLQAITRIPDFIGPINLRIVSSNTEQILADDNITFDNNLLMGLIKTIHHEIAWLSSQHLDLPIDRPERNAAIILDEFLFSRQPEVAYRNGQRFIPRLKKVDFKSIPIQPLPFQPNGLYLIHGELTDIGIAISKYLLQQYDARLLVVTTSPQNNLDELQQFTNQVSIQCFDVCNTEKLQQVINAIEIQWGIKLNGIIMLPDIAAAHSLLHETTDSMASNFRAAILAIWALHKLAEQYTNCLFVQFSSATSFFGGAAVGTLAAKACFQVSLYHYQKKSTNLQSYCFSWSSWDMRQFAGQIPAMVQPKGFCAISPAQGLHAFLAGLNHRLTSLFIGLDNSVASISAVLEQEPRALNKLCVYFTANRLIDDNTLKEQTTQDNLLATLPCDFVQLREPIPAKSLELWPSVAEYFVYDDLLYHAIAHDERRNKSYKIAIQQAVKDKIVVEIGTGKEAILAQFCCAAGAKHVYAIEIDKDAYQHAVATVKQLHLQDRITIIHGDSTTVNIAQLADVCVSEIVGPIGGCEGAAGLINDAWRFLKTEGIMIPAASITKIAAVQFPTALLADLGFAKVPATYTEKIFAEVGYPFDLRICIKNFPNTNILSSDAVFEHLDFSQPIPLEESHTINLTIHQNGKFNGFLVWLNLHLIAGEVIDILKHEYCWLPVYFPVFHPGIDVVTGDRITATCHRTLSDNHTNPDYHLTGRLLTANGDHVIQFSSYHHARNYKSTPFYAQLFAQHPAGVNTATRLAARLHHLPEMPLTPSGAIDKHRLTNRDKPLNHHHAIPENDIERQLLSIWQEILGISTIGRHANFFELGGHSLLLVQAQHKINTHFAKNLNLVEMFKYPTIDAMAAFLNQTEPQINAAEQGTARANVRNRCQTPDNNTDIAVIGLSCRFPGANTIDDFWHNLKNGIHSIADLDAAEIALAGIDPSCRKSPNYVKASPILADIAMFDADFFGVSKREAELMDPQQRLFLECAWESLECAGYDANSYKGAIGLYAGASMNTYLLNQVYPNRDKLDPNDNLNVTTLDSFGGFQMMVANDKDYLPTRTSYKLNLRGPSINVQTACSTTLVTIHLACQSLNNGECDMVLAGGASVQVPQTAGHLYQEGMIVSPDGHCRAFSDDAGGTIFGSGVGVVVLKRLNDAITAGDHIYAVIKGSAVNNDGAQKVGYTAPSADGQAAVVAEAIAMSGIDPATISYMEAHGTATKAGDPIEISGLTQGFRQFTDKTSCCAIGSVKTNVGHLQIASGVVGFIKTVLALYHQQIPASLFYHAPNPDIDFANSPFFVNTELTDWQRATTPLRAGVNSLGIGGTNAHVILEEAPQTTPPNNPIERPQHLLALSAKTLQALSDLVQRYATWLKSNQHLAIANICFTANTGRTPFTFRAAIRASTTVQLHQKLQDWRTPSQDANTAASKTQNHPKIAFLFTGQGAQYHGMGQQLYATQPSFRKTLNHCNDLLQGVLARPLLDLLFVAENATLLNETANTQPALFALEYALAKLWMAWGIKPAVLMGHSIGEYVGACLAGVFSLADGLKLIAARAQLMQALPQTGMMIVVWADAATIAPIIQAYLGDIAIAAINSPINTVISGHVDALTKVVATCQAKQIKTKQLNVSHAFHSPLMAPMIAAFKQVANTCAFAPPTIPIISNVTGMLANSAISTSDYWCSHIMETVKFSAGLDAIQPLCDIFIEIGPKPTLLGLARQCNRTDTQVWLPSLSPDEDDWARMLNSIQTLWLRGVEIDWHGFDQDYQRCHVVLPTYPFQHQRSWLAGPAVTKQRNTSKRHPLLAQAIQSPLLNAAIFATDCNTDDLAFLNDHHVYAKIVVSAACHITMVLAATEIVQKDSGCVLEDVIFKQPLVISKPQGCSIQLVMETQQDGYFSFKIISLPTDDPISKWDTHADGKVLPLTRTKPREFTFAELWERCPETISANAFYTTQSQRHIRLGPSYQWITAIRKGHNEAVCQLLMPADTGGIDRDELHPGLLDACFGLLTATATVAATTTLLPFSLDKLRFYQRPSNHGLWAYCQLRENTNDLVGDVYLVDGDGKAIIELIGLSGRVADQHTIHQHFQRDESDVGYQVIWEKKQNQNPAPSPKNQRWLIFCDQNRVGKHLVEQLQRHGCDCDMVFPGTDYQQNGSHFQVNPLHLNDFERLLKQPKNLEQPYHNIVHLWNIDSKLSDQTSASALQEMHILTCASVMHLVQAIAKNQHEWNSLPKLWLITCDVQPVSATPLPIQCQQATLWGIARVIELEHPELATVCIDIATSDATSTALFDNIWVTDGEPQIAIREDTRWVARLARLPLAKTDRSLPVHKHASYLITGGTGALGLTIAEWLTQQGADHLVLLSRNGAITSRAIQAVARLRQTGITVTIINADVANLNELTKVFAQIKSQMPPIRGVIHAAGILDDALLIQQSWLRCTNMMAAKVGGAWNLHRLTEHDNLEFFILFSSASAILGNQGQAHYAAANAFMDSLAHYRKKRGLAATSISWGPWQQGMSESTTTAKKQLKNRGLKPMATNTALHHLHQVVTANITHSCILHCDWQTYASGSGKTHFIEALLNQNQALAAGPSNKNSKILAAINAAPDDQQKALLHEFVTASVALVLGLDNSHTIEINKPLMEQHIDSLGLVELRNRLQNELNIKLAISLLFDFATIGAISDYLWGTFFVVDNTDEPDTDTALSDQQQKHDKVINSNNAGDDEFAYLNDLSDAALAEMINQEIPDD